MADTNSPLRMFQPIVSFEDRIQAVRDMVEQLPPAESAYVKPLSDYTRLQGAYLDEVSVSPQLFEAGILDRDKIYSQPKNPLDYPSEHPKFDEARTEIAQDQHKQLQQTLQQAVSQFEILPGKGSQEFTSLARDMQTWQRVAEEAKKTGKKFGDVWLQDVDTSKLSYVQQTQLAMEARFNELYISGMTVENANAQIQREFKNNIERINSDAAWREKFGMTAEEAAKRFEASTKGGSTLSFGKGRDQFKTELGYEAAKLGAAVVLDAGLTSIPIIGLPTVGYMAVTGDNIIINSVSEKPVELAWWERAALAIPVVGSIWRGAGALTKVVTKVFNESLGDAAKFVYTGGVNRASALAQRIKDEGKFAEIDEIIRQIDRGEIPVEAAERDLLNVLKAVNSKNRGSALATLNRGDLKPSPMVDLAKLAVLTGDAKARQKITETVLMVADDAADARSKAIIDALGLDSFGVQLISKDIRSLSRGTEEVHQLEKNILEARTKIAKAEAKLEKVKQDRADRVIKKANAAEVEKRAAAVKDFDEIASSDATDVASASVGQTIKAADGSESRVVAVTDDTVTVADASGVISTLKKDYPNIDLDVLRKRVLELGSIEKVELFYKDRGRLGEAAMIYAKELLGGGVKPATVVGEKVQKALRIRKARATFDELQTRLMNSPEPKDVEELGQLIDRLETDAKLFPDSAAHQSRSALIGEMKKFKSQLDSGDVIAEPAAKIEDVTPAKIDDDPTGANAAVAEVMEKQKDIPLVADVAPKRKTILRKGSGYHVIKNEASGQEEVFFHGTTKAFEEFDVNKGDLGLHFGTLQQAGARIKDVKGNLKEGANIRPVTLAFKKVIEMEDITFRNPDLIVASLARGKDLPTEEIIKLAKAIDSLGPHPDKNYLKLRAIRAALLRNGIDGIKYKNLHEGEGFSYLVLDPANNVFPIFKKGG